MENHPKTIKKMLVLNVKKYRAKLGLTQEQAAEKADLNLKYWQRLEMVSQIDLPSLPALGKMAKALNCKISDLLI